MLIPKHCFAAVEATTKDDPVLNGLQVNPDGSFVATDGHILAVVRPGEVPADSEFPIIDGVEHGTEPLKESCVLDAQALAKVAKAVPRKSTFPYVALSEAATNENGSAVLSVSDLETVQTFRIRKIEKPFPQWEKVVPTGTPEIVIGINPSLLMRLGKIAQAVRGDKAGTTGLKLSIYGPDKAVKVETLSSDPRFLGVAMPVRLKDDEV